MTQNPLVIRLTEHSLSCRTFLARTPLSQVEVEKAAVEARWRQASASEIATAQLQNALELASVRHAAMEANEQARATTRAAELQATIANAAAAAAEVKATAALVAEKRLAALVGPSNNDAQLKRAAELRLAALKVELEASKMLYEVRLRAASQTEKASLEEAEARVHLLERQAASCKAEIASLVDWNSAKTHEAHLSSIVQSHGLQLQLGEAASKLASAEAEVKHAPSAIVAPLEQAVSDAAAVLEHAHTETRAKREWAQTIADATLEIEKETAVVHAACAADKNVAEREGMASTAWAVEKATEAVEKARFKADELKAAAQKEYLDSGLRAERLEKQAMKQEYDAEKLPAADRHLQRGGADAKTPAEQAKAASQQTRADAEALRVAMATKLELKLTDAQKQLDMWLKEAEKKKKDAIERWEGCSGYNAPLMQLP